jgi:hypothetical protein
MARPKKDPKETRPYRVMFRLTAAEMKRLQRYAKAVGMEPNEYAREKTVRGEVRVREVRELPFAVVHELGRIGVNMNQLARRWNMTGEHEPEEVTAAFQHMDEVLGVILKAING